MLRAVVIVGFFAVLACTTLFGSGLLTKELINGETPLAEECNLLAGPCEWSDKNGYWRVELSVPTDSAQTKTYRLSVTTPGAPDRFLAVLRGESMYMGEYPVLLSNEEGSDGIYEASFTSPICSTGEAMIWRVDLQQGQNVIEHIPVKMVFQAHY